MPAPAWQARTIQLDQPYLHCLPQYHDITNDAVGLGGWRQRLSHRYYWVPPGDSSNNNWLLLQAAAYVVMLTGISQTVRAVWVLLKKAGPVPLQGRSEGRLGTDAVAGNGGHNPYADKVSCCRASRRAGGTVVRWWRRHREHVALDLGVTFLFTPCTALPS